MENIFAALFLLSIPVYLGFRHLIEYYEGPFSKSNFGISSLLVLVLYISYFCLFISLGIDELFTFIEHGRDDKKFITLFIYPSIGFGVAIFPKIASEYIFKSASIASLNFSYKLTSIIGWLIILHIISVLVL